MADDLIDIYATYSALVQQERKSGDIEQKASRSYLDENMTAIVGPSLPYGGIHEGIDAYLKMMNVVAESRQTISGMPEFECIQAGPDRLLILLKFTVRSPKTGRDVVMDMIEIMTFKDGKIASVKPYYWDSALIAEALGSATLPAGGED